MRRIDIMTPLAELRNDNDLSPDHFSRLDPDSMHFVALLMVSGIVMHERSRCGPVMLGVVKSQSVLIVHYRHCSFLRWFITGNSIARGRSFFDSNRAHREPSCICPSWCG